jgi:hypothetical protein
MSTINEFMRREKEGMIRLRDSEKRRMSLFKIRFRSTALANP